METRQETTRYDAAQRRKGSRVGKERGLRIYIPAAELRKAGIDPHGPEPEYRLHGYQRSRNGSTVIVTLYSA